MATFNHYKCDKCGCKIEVSGPHEFDYDKEGKIIQLVHPGTKLATGLFVKIYCLKCKKHFTKIVVEFKKKSEPWETPVSNIKDEYLKNYSGYIRDHPGDNVFTECYNYRSVYYCPECGCSFDDVVNGTIKDRILFPHHSSGYFGKNNSLHQCPKCKDGNLDLQDWCIS